MLKKFLNVSKNTRVAIYKASAWLAIFQLIAMVPLVMIYKCVLKSKVKCLKWKDSLKFH